MSASPLAAGIQVAGADVSSANPVPTTNTPPSFSGPVHTSVAAATSDTALLAANANRRPGSTIVNDGAATLYIKLGSGSSSTSYWVALPPATAVGGVAELPSGYVGAVYGTWSVASGAARITEMQ